MEATTTNRSPLARCRAATTSPASFAAQLIRLVGRAASIGLSVDDMIDEAPSRSPLRDDVEVVQFMPTDATESSAVEEEAPSSKATTTEDSPEASSELASAEDLPEASSDTASAKDSPEVTASAEESSEVDHDGADADPVSTLQRLRGEEGSEVSAAAGRILSVVVEQEIVVEEVSEVRIDPQSLLDEDLDARSANDEAEGPDARWPVSPPKSPSSPTSSAGLESPTDFSLEMEASLLESETADDGSVDVEMFDAVERSVSARGVLQASPQASGSTDDGDNPPTGDGAAQTKKISVCKHCGREFVDAIREMTKHKSVCEVLQQKTALQESLPPQTSPEPNTRDAPTADADLVVEASDDANDASAHYDTRSPPAPRDDAVVASAPSDTRSPPTPSDPDDQPDEDTEMQDTSMPQAPATDGGGPKDDDAKAPTTPGDVQEHDEQERQQQQQQGGQQPTTDRALGDGYRVIHDASNSKATKAECLHCGKVLSYRKGNVLHHVSSCPSNPSNRASVPVPTVAKKDPTTPPTSPSTAPMKRKYLMTEMDIAGASSADLVPRKTKPPQGDLQFAISLQTPRRSKRIKRDPSQSPKKTVAHTTATTRAPPPSTPPVATPVDGPDDDHPMDDDDTHAANSAVAMKLRDDESTDSEISQAVVYRCMDVDDLRRMDHVAAAAWMFGSSENAATMKLRYRNSALAVHGVYARFYPLVRATMGDLKASKLVETAPPSTLFTLFVGSGGRSSAEQQTESVTVSSKREALALYDLGCALSLPAPATIADVVVPLLAQDLQISALVNADAHTAKAVCCQAGATIPWQFYRDDCFVVDLKGTVRWKTKRGPVRFPIQDYRPRSSAPTALVQQREEETHVKVNCASAGESTPVFLLPPTEDYHVTDGDDDASAICEATLTPGSVLYVPGGTWFEAEVVEDATWLEIRVANTSPADLIGDALRQLCWMDERWREPMLQSQDVKDTHKALSRLLKDLGTKIASLSPFDLLPEEVQLLDGAGDAAPARSFDAGEAAGAEITIDLSQHKFRGGKHIKIFKTIAFRQNRLAFLTTLHELPSVTAMAAEAPRRDGHATGAASKKKALKNPKKSSVRPTPQRTPHVANAYLLHVNFGSADLRSKMRVQFRCDAFQAAIVEWVRKQRGAPFHASDALKFVQSQHRLAKPHDEDEGTKYVLRFLCTVGFISPTKLPPE